MMKVNPNDHNETSAPVTHTGFPLASNDVSTPSATSEPLSDIPTGVTIRRVTVLVIYCCFILMNQVQYVGNAYIVDPLSNYLGCSNSDINYLAVAFAAVYVVLAFPACEVFARVGLKSTLVLGLIANFTGSLIKYIAMQWWPAFWLVMLGQVISGLAQVLCISVPPLLAAVWFPVDERAIATSVGTLFGFIGMAIGFAIPPAVISTDGGRDSKLWFAGLYGVQMGLCFINLVAGIFFVPVLPEIPPSVSSPQYLELRRRLKPTSADVVTDNETVGITAHAFSKLWAARTNRDFVLTVIAFGIAAGTLTGMSAVLSQMLQPFGVSDSMCGVITAVALVCGSVGCVAAGPIMDTYRIYKKPLLVLHVCLFTLLVIFSILLGTVDPGSSRFVPIAFVGIGLVVIFLLPTLPFGLELCVELTFPLDEAISSTACFWSNAVFSAIATVGATLVVGDAATVIDSTCIVAAAAVLMGTCFVLVFFGVEERLSRLEHERQTAQQSAANTASKVQDEHTVV